MSTIKSKSLDGAFPPDQKKEIAQEPGTSPT
jgi:hypothetical protein